MVGVLGRCKPRRMLGNSVVAAAVVAFVVVAEGGVTCGGGPATAVVVVIEEEQREVAVVVSMVTGRRRERAAAASGGWRGTRVRVLRRGSTALLWDEEDMVLLKKKMVGKETTCDRITITCYNYLFNIHGREVVFCSWLCVSFAR